MTPCTDSAFTFYILRSTGMTYCNLDGQSGPLVLLFGETEEEDKGWVNNIGEMQVSTDGLFIYALRNPIVYYTYFNGVWTEYRDSKTEKLQ
jgi:hypothetical protein